MKKVLALLLLTIFATSTFAKKVTPAVFPEGDFEEWVYERIAFPELARKDKMTGIISTEITINEEGFLLYAKINETPHHSITDEFRKVVYSSPDWQPAKEKKTNIKYTFPLEIDFSRLLTPEEIDEFTVVTSFEHPTFIEDEKGSYAFRRWIYNHFEPIDKDLITDETPKGSVTLDFGVSATGQMIDISIQDGAPQEVVDLLTNILKEATYWAEAAEVNGEPHDYHYELPIAYLQLPDSSYVLKPIRMSNDQMPSFKGGEGLGSFRYWVTNRLKYPAKLADKNISARVVLQFVVERDGSISNVVVVESTNEKLAEDAVKVVESSPKWAPGQIDGTPSRIKYTLPIVYKVGDNAEEDLYTPKKQNVVPPLDRTAGPQRAE